MFLRLVRWCFSDSSTNGDLSVGDSLTLCALENAYDEKLESIQGAGKAIPFGTYRVALTVSERAKAGKLWTPDPDHRLPLLLDVPGRSGIRIHAGNIPANTEGCILVGKSWTVGSIYDSRVALTALMKLLTGDDTITVCRVRDLPKEIPT